MSRTQVAEMTEVIATDASKHRCVSCGGVHDRRRKRQVANCVGGAHRRRFTETHFLRTSDRPTHAREKPTSPRQSEKKVEELKNNLELNKHKDIELTPIKQLTVNRYTSLKADLLCEWCKQNYEVKEYQLETMNKSFLHSKVIDLCEKMIDLDFKSSHPYLKLLNIYIHYDKMDNYLRISKKYKEYKKNNIKDNE